MNFTVICVCFYASFIMLLFCDKARKLQCREWRLRHTAGMEILPYIICGTPSAPFLTEIGLMWRKDSSALPLEYRTHSCLPLRREVACEARRRERPYQIRTSPLLPITFLCGTPSAPSPTEIVQTGRKDSSALPQNDKLCLASLM